MKKPTSKKSDLKLVIEVNGIRVSILSSTMSRKRLTVPVPDGATVKIYGVNLLERDVNIGIVRRKPPIKSVSVLAKIENLLDEFTVGRNGEIISMLLGCGSSATAEPDLVITFKARNHTK